MTEIDLWLRAWIFSIAFVLFAISLIGYLRTRERPMMLVSGVFGLFALKGLVLSLAIFFDSVEGALESYHLDRVLDLAILVFLLLAIWGLPRGLRKGETD